MVAARVFLVGPVWRAVASQPQADERTASPRPQADEFAISAAAHRVADANEVDQLAALIEKHPKPKTSNLFLGRRCS